MARPFHSVRLGSKFRHWYRGELVQCLKMGDGLAKVLSGPYTDTKLRFTRRSKLRTIPNRHLPFAYGKLPKKVVKGVIQEVLNQSKPEAVAYRYRLSVTRVYRILHKFGIWLSHEGRINHERKVNDAAFPRILHENGQNIEPGQVPVGIPLRQCV